MLENSKPEENDKEKIKTVLDILAKSGVRYIELHNPLENNSVMQEGGNWYVNIAETSDSIP